MPSLFSQRFVISGAYGTASGNNYTVVKQRCMKCYLALSAPSRFSEEEKSFLGNFIASYFSFFFMLKRKILSSFFFSQLIELFHRTMKKKKI